MITGISLITMSKIRNNKCSDQRRKISALKKPIFNLPITSIGFLPEKFTVGHKFTQTVFRLPERSSKKENGHSLWISCGGHRGNLVSSDIGCLLRGAGNRSEGLEEQYAKLHQVRAVCKPNVLFLNPYDFRFECSHLTR